MLKNTFFRVHNDTPQEERRAVQRNDARVRQGGTYHQFAAGEAGIIGGRYAAEAKQHVVGSKPLVEYPQLPETSPWHHDPVPDELPIDIDISAAPIVGEFHEVAASQTRQGINPLTSPPSDLLPSGDARSSGPLPSGSSEAATSPPLKQKRRRK